MVILEMLKTSSTLKSVLLACLGSALIGSSGIFVRLSDLGPLTTGFYRMLFALPLLAVWMRWERKKGVVLTVFPRKQLTAYIFAGAFFAFDLALWNWSIDRTTIVNSTLFNNTAAFFVPLIMWLIFRERQSFRFIVTVSIGFIGCTLLIGESLAIGYQNLFGDIVALCSGLMVALYLISLKRIRTESATGFLMFWTGGISVLFLGSLAYMSGESFWPLSINDFTSILGQALLVHVLGQSLLAYSLGKIQANYVALILFLAPASAAILGWIFYGEALSLIKLIGIVLIMASIICVKKRA